MTEMSRDVAGRCPACGRSSLFLASGGHVTCRRTSCPKPWAADDLLHNASGTRPEKTQ